VRLRYLVILTLAIATAAFYVGVKLGVREFKEVDELGERHEVIVAGPYVVIKHGPSAHQRDFNKAVRYIETRRASWERWKKLLDKYRDEAYKAYVVPCRIYAFEEFSTLAKSLGLTDKIVEVVTYVYYKNGTYESLGHSIRLEGYSFDEWLESIKERAFISTAIISTGEPPLNVTEAVELGQVCGRGVRRRLRCGGPPQGAVRPLEETGDTNGRHPPRPHMEIQGRRQNRGGEKNNPRR
jgi:hypothetical protein